MIPSIFYLVGFATGPAEPWVVQSQDASVWTVQFPEYDDAKCGIALCGDPLRQFQFDDVPPASTTWTVQ